MSPGKRRAQDANNSSLAKVVPAKSASCHTLRQSFAMYLVEDGYDIRALQELLGHRAVRATLAYTSVLNRRGKGDSSAIECG
jgi:site-specific recombinase XerD